MIYLTGSASGVWERVHGFYGLDDGGRPVEPQEALGEVPATGR